MINDINFFITQLFSKLWVSRDMKGKNYKTALLSGLLFPGVGYLPIKLYRRALITIIPAIVFLYGVIQINIIRSQALMDLLVTGKVAPDIISMLQALEQVSMVSMGWQDFAGYGFMLCWAGSVFDGFRLANKE